MKANEIKDMTVDELNSKLAELKTFIRKQESNVQ